MNATVPVQEAGVQAHVLWDAVSRAEMFSQLDAAKASGATLVRVDVGWSTLEKDGKGAYDSAYVARLDAAVEALEARALKPVIVFFGTPCWASTAPAQLKRDCAGAWWERQVDLYPPADPRDYADAMVQLAQRYGPRVLAWEIWNEPNIEDFWRPAPSAAAYSALVRATYERVKAASPSSTILAGSLSGADERFTDELYANGIEGHFDGFSIHPYAPSPLWRGRSRDSYVGGVPAVRAVMSRWGDARPLWLTEFGWNTSMTRGAPVFWRNGVSEATQAAYLNQAFALMQQWPYVRAGVWYALRDRNGDRADYLGNFGLQRHDGARKPSFAAMQHVTSGLSGGLMARTDSWSTVAPWPLPPG